MDFTEAIRTECNSDYFKSIDGTVKDLKKDQFLWNGLQLPGSLVATPVAGSRVGRNDHFTHWASVGFNVRFMP